MIQALIAAVPNWTRILIAALAALLALQSLRIDGLRLPLVGTVVTGFKAQNAALRAENAALIAASNAAAFKALQDKLRREATNQLITERANNAESQELRSELDRARAFIRMHQAANHSGGTPATASDRSAGNDAGGGALPFVDGVSADDILICTENTVKARAWREWGLSISAASQE